MNAVSAELEVLAGFIAHVRFLGTSIRASAEFRKVAVEYELHLASRESQIKAGPGPFALPEFAALDSQSEFELARQLVRHASVMRRKGGKLAEIAMQYEEVFQKRASACERLVECGA